MTRFGYALEVDASLRELNTFGIEARARWLARVHDCAALPALFADPRVRGLPHLVLGCGSNVLLTRDWPGVVVTIESDRVEIIDDDAGVTTVRADAGLGWNALVDWTLDRGIVGLENLVSIPGKVGAAPIQNIGAYGVELDAFVDAVEVFDPDRGAFASLDRAGCRFAYRDSVFKSDPAAARLIVTAVRFGFPKHRALVLHYPGVREALGEAGVSAPTARDVATVIAAIRARKLPNPAVIGNAGSFFKNPMVSRAIAETLEAAHPGLPVYSAANGLAKLPAAWLIERAGFKGHRDGDAGVSPDHALVLVNHGEATGAGLLALVQRIQREVERRFGVALEIEPRVVD